MPQPVNNAEVRINDLKGFAGKSQQNLAKVGINSVDEFMAADPYELYKKLKETVPGTSLNFIYGIIAAQENKHRHQIIREHKTEILFRLDDMGLAPTSSPKKKAIE